MYIVEKITGAGYDCYTAGHYDTLQEAMDAVANECDRKGYIYTEVFVEASNMYIMTAETPYFLEYQIKVCKVGGPLR